VHRRRDCSAGEVLVYMALHEDVADDNSGANAEKMLRIIMELVVQ
jgi:hypothetical protein